MIRKKLIVRLIFAPKTSFPKPSANFSVLSEIMVNEYKSELASKKEKITWKEPFGKFKSWYDEACATPDILEPRAMCLQLVPGIPSARFVILRDYSTDGFQFFTNYRSRKGEELNENPNAAVVFYWEFLKKSIRIEGSVEKLNEEKSTQFFHSRPKNYQIEAAFNDQSQPISSRSALREKEKNFSHQYKNCDFIPKPNDWGGFILNPHTIEFWQSRSDDIHDRICFRVLKADEIIDNIILHQGKNGWVYERLQP